MPSRYALRMHMAVIALSRLLAVLWLPLCAWGLARMVYAISAVVESLDWPDENVVWSLIYHVLFTFAQCLFVFVLARYAGKIADWVVPAARNRCPACGYPRANPTVEKCSECSLSLDA